MLYFSRAIVGLGASAVYLSLVKETARTFTRNFTVMLGLLVLIGYTGGIMANAPFIAGVQIVGWRMMLKIIAAATFLAYLIFVGIKFTLKMPAIQNVPFSFTPFLELLKRRHNRQSVSVFRDQFRAVLCSPDGHRQEISGGFLLHGRSPRGMDSLPHGSALCGVQFLRRLSEPSPRQPAQGLRPDRRTGLYSVLSRSAAGNRF